ncbi:SH2B adapter protein 2-like [Arapaima gigas]
MNGDARPSSPDLSSCPLPDWKEFCELHARASASDFADKFRRFVSENPSYDAPGADTSFSQHFAQHFLECFAAELSRPRTPGSPGGPRYSIVPFAGLQSCPLPYGHDLYLRRRDVGASSESLDSMDSGPGSRSPRARTAPQHKTPTLGQSRSSEDISAGHTKARFKKGFSLRNMSLCVVDGVKEIWHRRSSPEPESGRRANGDNGDKWSQRLRLSRASHARRAEQRDIQREGALRYMVADDTSCMGSSQWQKCRLLLRKAPPHAEGERFLLEFYVPPKSSKPKVSVPLSAIIEVRTTMPLEMPDKDNTFVLKVENGEEYILETIDSLQKHSWVADIQDCIDPGGDDIELASCPHGQPHREFPMVSSCSCELLSEGMHRAPERSCAAAVDQHVVPAARCLQSSLSEHPSHIPLERFLQMTEGAGSASAGHGEGVPEVEADASLSRYPWFHGTLSRVRAAQLVLAGGTRSHGLFVIRQSETRPGEYVLTFNFQGKAKHLRLSVNDNGQCHVHHLWFQTVSDMLQHFHAHPIPLESGGSADITLRCYVQAQHSPSEPGVAHAPVAPRDPSCQSESHHSPPMDRPLSSSPSSSPTAPVPFSRTETAGANGLRSRSNSSERLLEPPSGSAEDYHDSDSTRRARAVENQYSFY